VVCGPAMATKHTLATRSRFLGCSLTRYFSITAGSLEYARSALFASPREVAEQRIDLLFQDIALF